MPEIKRVPANGAALSTASAPATPDDALVIEAPAFAQAVEGKGLAWQVIPHLGRTQGAVATFPQGQAASTPADGIRLDYAVDLAGGGDLAVELQLVPTLDPDGRNALQIGISLDDGPVQILTDRLMPAPNGTTMQEQRNWTKAVIENASSIIAHFPAVAPGPHVLRVWRIDDNVVLQRLVLRVAP